jgi:hypothetical protein
MQCCFPEPGYWCEHVRLLDSFESSTNYHGVCKFSDGLQFFSIGSGWCLVLLLGMAD